MRTLLLSALILPAVLAVEPAPVPPPAVSPGPVVSPTAPTPPAFRPSSPMSMPISMPPRPPTRKEIELTLVPIGEQVDVKATEQVALLGALGYAIVAAVPCGNQVLVVQQRDKMPVAGEPAEVTAKVLALPRAIPADRAKELQATIAAELDKQAAALKAAMPAAPAPAAPKP